MKKEFQAWAIKSKTYDWIKDQQDGFKASLHVNQFFLGVYYFHRGELEDYQDGIRTCLFRTRQ